MDSTKKYILGIESSCDDTSAAVIYNDNIISNVIANQNIHKNYGGVVPELASRAHQINIIPVINEALQQANVDKSDLKAIAVTSGPGLMGSLLVGTSVAKSMALALNIPIVEVNHMQAHVLAHFIEDASEQKPNFPFLCLTVSGGHTQLILVKDYFDYELLGETLDDAAGEAFDKSGKLLGLGYPAGPEIDRRSKLGNPNFKKYSKPKTAEYHFSFSGLKTAILYDLQKEVSKNSKYIEENINDLCASIQSTIVDILISELVHAAKALDVPTVAIAGGVSANSGLRHALIEASKSNGWSCHIPKVAYTTDNAAMIAQVGSLKYDLGAFSDVGFKTNSRLKLIEK